MAESTTQQNTKSMKTAEGKTDKLYVVELAGRS